MIAAAKTQHIRKQRIKILHHGIMLAAPQTPLLHTYLGRPLAMPSVRPIIGTELDALANQYPERDLDREPSNDDGPH
jgi:hypothetical protein